MVKGREYTFHIELAMTNASGAGWNATIVDEHTVGVSRPFPPNKSLTFDLKLRDSGSGKGAQAWGVVSVRSQAIHNSL
jgi:hypothetical protein